MKCQCCETEAGDLVRLPCGARVCEECYNEDFWGGEVCPPTEPGTDVDCLDCIFGLCERGPGYLIYSDALPGF